jgi:hypothetical protein
MRPRSEPAHKSELSEAEVLVDIFERSISQGGQLASDARVAQGSRPLLGTAIAPRGGSNRSP